MGKMKRDWQDTDTVLSYFGSGRKKAILRYEKFVKDGLCTGQKFWQDEQDEQDYFIHHHNKFLIKKKLDNSIGVCL